MVRRRIVTAGSWDRCGARTDVAKRSAPRSSHTDRLRHVAWLVYTLRLALGYRSRDVERPPGEAGRRSRHCSGDEIGRTGRADAPKPNYHAPRASCSGCSRESVIIGREEAEGSSPKRGRAERARVVAGAPSCSSGARPDQGAAVDGRIRRPSSTRTPRTREARAATGQVVGHPEPLIGEPGRRPSCRLSIERPARSGLQPAGERAR